MTRRWGLRLSLALAATVGVSGCAVLDVKEQRREFEEFARIRGEVRLEAPSTNSIVVVLGRKRDESSAVAPAPDEPESIIVDHFPLERPGRFTFAVSPGTYRLSAFEDRNANLSYDPGEAVLAGQPYFDLGVGATLDGIELVIPRDGRLGERYDIAALQARAPKDQQHFSIGRFTVRGEVVDLADPKFGLDNGKLGMWRFVDFLFEVGPGVYFLEPYDPRKIPVLFVHGASGYPQQFSTLIEGLDRERFQPWFYFYPSGIHLDGLAEHLSTIVTELQIEHGFDELAVVAHSMGGLVARAFILRHYEQTGRRDVELFVSISSPWGGNEDAADIDEAPQDLMVYSWLDMSPKSDFLRSLFHRPPDYRQERPLPRHSDFHMIFGYEKDEMSMGPSEDGVVTVRSAARLEAVRAAQSVLPLHDTHVGILDSPHTVERLNAILRDAFGTSD